MTPTERQQKEARGEALWNQMGGVQAMLHGTLMRKHNRVERKDGSIHVSPEHWTFQYRGADGKRKWKRIPRNAKTTVQRLVEAGERYRKLEQEYRALRTELALSEDVKKNG